ncbi:MAG: hypothetical protein JW881_15390 [Spirochaetales bacterium]|nr:hypothetical protein [Spirochaetales bacterium]
MKGIPVFAAVLVFLGFIVCCVDTGGSGTGLKAALLEATITALQLEIGGYEKKLEAAEGGLGPEGNAEIFGARIAELRKELGRFQAMKPEDYPDPVTSLPGEGHLPPDDGYGPVFPAEKKNIFVTVGNEYAYGSLLDVDGSSRSGPFFRLAGIKGGDPGVLKKGRRYTLEVYCVYRREYFGFIEDYYVYVSGIGK